jgi:hypothetical protein
MEEQEKTARSQFTKKDLLIRTTRFGLGDGHPRHQHHRRRVEMSGNLIEGRFAMDWRRYFAHLSRTEIGLKDQACQVLPI